MSINSVVMGILNANAALLAKLPADKQWWGNAPQGIAAPFLVASLVSTDPANTTDEGTIGTRAQLDNTQVQISIYGSTTADAVAIAKLARRALTNETTLRAMCVGDEETFEQDINLRGRFLTFSCWYAEDIAA